MDTEKAGFLTRQVHARKFEDSMGSTQQLQFIESLPLGLRLPIMV